MRKRTLWVGLAALVGTWLVPAAFVAVYDPSLPRARLEKDRPRLLEPVRGSREPRFFLLSDGYSKEWTVETWTDDEPPDARTVCSYLVERGPLDRRSATFRLAVSCGRNHAREVEGVRLFVTRSSDWSHDADEDIWERVAEASVREPGADQVALACEAMVRASTTAYRLQEVRRGVASGGFSQSILTAPTFLGRMYDAIAWRAPFAWVPDLR